MKPNLWSTMFAARRRAIDRALLASLEREIANEEKLRANPAYQADVAKMKRWTQEVINEQTDAERKRIARAFGRPH